MQEAVEIDAMFCSYWLHPYASLSIWLQLLEVTNNAAEWTRSWIRRAKDAAQYGETLWDVNIPNSAYLQVTSGICLQ